MSERRTNPEAEPAAGAEEVDIPARNALVEEHLPMTKWGGKKYGAWAKELGYDQGDVNQHGALGLIRAAEKFQPEYGAAFPTYASHWIRSTARRGIFNEAWTIRMPVHDHEKVRVIENLKYRLAAELGRTPEPAELAERAGVAESEIQYLRFMEQPPESLDEPVEFPDEPGPQSELVAERTEAGPMEQVIDEEERRLALEGVAEALELLPENEREVVVLRYRLDGSEGEKLRTRKEIGEIQGHSGEQARLLENRALKKIAAMLEGEPVPECPQVRIGPEVREKGAAVIAVTARHVRVNEEEIVSDHRGHRGTAPIGNARQIAALILREKLDYSQEMIAGVLGYANRGSVSSTLTQARNKRLHNADFAALYRLVDESYGASAGSELPQ
jgi:RNA polymerase primary sigma factor